MSIIVAVKHNGRVVMGADTQTSYGSEKRNSLRESNFKIRKLADGLLVGGTGDTNVVMRLLCHKGIFTVPSEGLTKKHIVTRTIPAVFRFLEENHLFSEDEEDNDEPPRMDCDFILAHKNKLFYIGDDFSVTENAVFSAAGSGKPYAIPRLTEIDFQGDVRAQLVAAMQASAEHDNSVSGPFILIDSGELSFTAEGGAKC